MAPPRKKTKDDHLDWKRLGEHVAWWRNFYGFSKASFAEAAEMSVRALDYLERGRGNTLPDVLSRVEVRLMWTPGDAAKVLRGEDPQPRFSEMDDTERAIASLEKLTPYEIWAMIALYRKDRGLPVPPPVGRISDDPTGA